jgi:hypothetical protein
VTSNSCRCTDVGFVHNQIYFLQTFGVYLLRLQSIQQPVRLAYL